MHVRKFLAGTLLAAILSSAPVIAGQNRAGQNQAQTQAQTPPGQGGNTRVPPAGAPAGPGQGAPGTAIGVPGAANRRERPSAYPSHNTDPAAAARGKAIFGVNCSFCHGSDARGGEGGPNLIRSALVLNDKNGEAIAPVVQNGRPDRGMPKFPLSEAQIADIAAYIHSFRVGGYDESRMQPPSILVGDAKAGESAFQAKCASCHSTSGDLKGIGAKITDPKTLQQTWLMPAGAGRGFPGQEQVPLSLKPTTVSVTLPSGEKIEGKLDRIDDFVVSLTDAQGDVRTFARTGDAPKVEVHDPAEPHRELLRSYTDADIHNITAFLVTLK